MPRAPRSLLGDRGTYHVTVRGTARADISHDDVDRRTFFVLLATARGRFGWTLHAACLMPNHFHLVVEGDLVQLSRGMHWLNGCYAQQFNRRHGRVGHLFQERFGVRVVEGDGSRERVCTYVIHNPVRAGLCETAAAWPWSWWPASGRTLASVGMPTAKVVTPAPQGLSL